MPVYNGEQAIGRSLDAVLAQTFVDFELIVSDNASTDETETICREYASRDPRIVYVRQPVNIGAAGNFKHVLAQARGEFFMWWASDDTRSDDFIELNTRFLEERPDYVASTSPNRMEEQMGSKDNLVTFSMTGNVEDRFRLFFDNCWRSHGIFYSLIRTNCLRACTEVGADYFGADWSIDLFLATSGNVGRVERGLAVFGSKGMSSRPNAWADYRCRPQHWFMPFYEFSCYAYRLASGFSWGGRMGLVGTLFKLNAVSAIFQLCAEARDLIALVKRRFGEFVSSRACCRLMK
jgi:glycosyltransferase involved in cell wall biosynthesis